MVPVDFRLLSTLFINTNNITFPPLSVVITIAITDCAKENRTILEKTTKPINDGLWSIAGNI